MLDCGDAQALRPGVSGGEVTRGDRRPLDVAPRARSAPWAEALPGLRAGPQGDRAEHPVGPAEAHGGPRARRAALLLRPPAAGRVPVDGARARARRRRRCPCELGSAPRAPLERARARRLWAPGGDEVLLPALRDA